MKNVENKMLINGTTYIRENLAPKKDNLTYCIVRTYSAGVFAGWYEIEKLAKVGVVHDARRIWCWDGACSLSQLAREGTKKPEACKFSVHADEYLTEIIEVLPCTEEAKKSIEGVKEWKR